MRARMKAIEARIRFIEKADGWAADYSAEERRVMVGTLNDVLGMFRVRRAR